MKPKRPRISRRKTYYLVLWWMSQTPYAAIFENEVAAEAAANVRNALLVTISGRDAKVDQILDWYRRDESGRPMPAKPKWPVRSQRPRGDTHRGRRGPASDQPDCRVLSNRIGGKKRLYLRTAGAGCPLWSNPRTSSRNVRRARRLCPSTRRSARNAGSTI